MKGIVIKDLIDKIIEYQSAVFSLFGVTFYGFYRSQKAKRQSKEVKMEAKFSDMEGALKAILHDRIYTQCQSHLDAGEISIGALDNLTHLFKGYKSLGGNGTGEAIYNEVKDLPKKKGNN